MKIAVSSLVWSKKPLREALSFIADNGFTYVDLGTLQGWAHVHPQQLMDNLQKQAAFLTSLLDEFGLKVIAFNGGVQSLEQWDALLSFANRMDVQSVTLGAPKKMRIGMRKWRDCGNTNGSPLRGISDSASKPPPAP